MSEPLITVKITQRHRKSDAVSVTVSEQRDFEHCLNGAQITSIPANLRERFSINSSAHTVGFENALRSAQSEQISTATADLQRRLVQLEALTQYARLLLCHIPQYLGMPTRPDWFDDIDAQLKQAIAQLILALHHHNSINDAIECDANVRQHIARFLQNSGWLSQLTLALEQWDWEWVKHHSQSSWLERQWAKVTQDILALATDKSTTAIGQCFTVNDSFTSAKASSQVCCASGVLSYDVQLDPSSKQLLFVHLSGPAEMRFQQSSAATEVLLTIPDTPLRLQRAKLCIALLAPCYPLSISYTALTNSDLTS